MIECSRGIIVWKKMSKNTCCLFKLNQQSFNAFITITLGTIRYLFLAFDWINPKLEAIQSAMHERMLNYAILGCV